MLLIIADFSRGNTARRDVMAHWLFPKKGEWPANCQSTAVEPINKVGIRPVDCVPFSRYLVARQGVRRSNGIVIHRSLIRPSARGTVWPAEAREGRFNPLFVCQLRPDGLLLSLSAF